MNQSPNNEASRPLERRTVLGICIGLVMLVWMAFGQAIHFGFVNFDDDVYVYKNAHVTDGVTGAGVRWAFTHVYSSNWHPLTWLSHMLDCQFYGLNAGGHHLTNILIHAATVVVLFLLLYQLTGFLWRSTFVAAVFAIHPLRVESVVWVAERKDVLSAFFFMLTIAAYVRYVRRPPSIYRYSLVVLMFSLALMSKPMTVTLPFVLLLLDYWPLKRLPADRPVWWRCVVEKIPLLALSAGVCAITVLAQKGAVSPLPLSLRLENAAVSCGVYLRQMIYPSGLVVLYPFPESGVPGWKIFWTCFVLVSISAAVIAARRKCPWLLFGWLWYLGMLVPVIGILQVGAQAHADRYTYLPQIGLYLAVVWSAAELAVRANKFRFALAGASAAIVALLSIDARQQTAYWRDSVALWNRALAFTSDNIIAQNNLGNALLDRGAVDKAIAHFREARRIKPEDAQTAFNLGNALIEKGELNDGIANLRQAVMFKPDYAEAQINLGSALLKTGETGEAITHFHEALRIEPNQSAAWNDLGYAYLQQGTVTEAAACFGKAMQIDPKQPVTLNNVANALMQQGKVDEAIGYYQQALQLKPAYAEAEYNLGTALAQKNNLEEAIIHFEKALLLKPDYASAAYNIGVALFHEDKVEQAAAFFQKAIQIKPDYAEAHYNLGNALIREQKIDEAIAQFRKALEIDPGQLVTRNNLGYVLLQSGKVDGAIDEFTKVLQARPDSADAHFNLGKAFLQKGNIFEAAAHFEQALNHEPDFAEGHYSLATAFLQEGREAEALAQLQKAIQLKPDYSEALNDLAWELATAPQASARDGSKAVELAQRADQLTGSKDLDILDTVAAAYAEAHRFDEAVRTAKQAIAFAHSSGQEGRVAQLSGELKLYEAGHPFHREAANQPGN